MSDISSFRMVEHRDHAEDRMVVRLDVLYGGQQFSAALDAIRGDLPISATAKNLSFGTEKDHLVRALRGLAEKLETVKPAT